MDDLTGPAPDEAATLTEAIIERFGGIRPMANKLDTPVTTVQGWKKRGVIPASRHADILAAAAREAIEIDPAQLALTDPGGTADRPEPRIASGPETVAAPQIQYRPAQARSGGGLALFVTMIALVVAAGAAGAGWKFYVEPLRTHVAALETRLAKLEPGTDLVRRLDVLESEIAQRPATAASSAGGDHVAGLEQDVAKLKADTAQIEQLAKRLGDLQIAAGGRELLAQSITDIQTTTAATQGEVERLSAALKGVGLRLDQVDAVLSDRRQQALKAEAVILAVGQLRAALRGSKPFTQEIVALKAVTENDGQIAAAMDPIRPFADTGVPTSDELRASLSTLAPEVVRGAVVGDGSKWWRQALYRIASVVSIRRVGEAVPGNTADAIVARAEAKLDEDDLESAVATLRGLRGLPGESAASWLRDAEQRLTADAAEAELTRLAISRVSADRNEPVKPAVSAAPAPGAPAAPAQADQPQ